MVKKIVLFVLSSVLGLVFLYSAYTKLYPIEPFELTFVDIGVSNWRLAPFMARFMIGLEFFIGLSLIFGMRLKRFTLPLTIFSLLIFSLYLVMIIASTGNNGNCGCFGTAIVMTPLQALIKNTIMLVVSVVLLKLYDGFAFGKIEKWLFIAVFVTSFAMPHILNYVDMDFSSAYLNKKESQFKLELDSLYKDAKIHEAPKTLSKGKHIISFMSLSCPHCRVAAKKLKLIKEKNAAIPMYLVLNGEYKKIQEFYEDTKAYNIEYSVLNGRNFVYLAGLKMPVIYLVNNSTVEHSLDYLQLDQTEIEKWLKKP